MGLDARGRGGAFNRGLSSGVTEHRDEQGLDGGLPFWLPNARTVRQHTVLLDVRVRGASQAVKRRDHVDDHAVVMRSDEASDPVAWPSMVREGPFAHALPI